ncbi:MAG TPA: cytochrome d ubiquinol oxidase subunit II [Acidimicrobiales bacterium]|nr:cytochrome d ubiquinol oxidase subunit II [Acidimicrobiales bacterium]
MSLHTLWFGIVAIFWCGFFVLEGFDFGVGMLHTIVGRTDLEQRTAVNTIGPFWDGNEVWLIVAGAAIFAAFPSWYATMFSTFYLALLLVLVALFARGVSFEYRGKVEAAGWRSAWTWGLTLGSALIPLLLGVALGDLLHGLPINSQHEFTGNFGNLLTGYGIYTGVTFLLLCLLNGANFLTLKTLGPVQTRSIGLVHRFGWAVGLVTVGFVIWTRQVAGGFLPDPVAITAAIAVIASVWLAATHFHGWAFAASVVGMAGAVGTIFIELYKNVMVSSTNSAYNLTVANASASSYALKVMTVVAVIFMPLVLLYQGWNYWVFRQRLVTPPADPTAGTAQASGPIAEAPSAR